MDKKDLEHMIDHKTASIELIQDGLVAWQTRNFPKSEVYTKLKIKHLKYGIIEEMGELFHAVLKLEQGIRGTPEEHAAAIKDAVGDMFVYAAQWSSVYRSYINFICMPYTDFSLIGLARRLVWAVDNDDVVGASNYIIRMARLVGVDPEECFRMAAAEAMSRDWVKYPKTGKPEPGEVRG